MVQQKVVRGFFRYAESKCSLYFVITLLLQRLLATFLVQKLDNFRQFSVKPPVFHCQITQSDFPEYTPLIAKIIHNEECTYETRPHFIFGAVFFQANMQP